MSESKLTDPKFKGGDIVAYFSLDKESLSKGFGVHYDAKASTIVSICYKMANGDIVEEKDLVLVESKSEQSKKE